MNKAGTVKVIEIANDLDLGFNKIKDLGDLETYYINQDKIMKIKKEIAKKLGKRSGLTQYEEAYIEKWINDYKYDMNVIEQTQIIKHKKSINQYRYFEYDLKGLNILSINLEG